ncbi:MAG: N-acetyltransferase [Bacteroidales bacterium]|nr:N-acetyltransferase [Candidatus Cryptobacteroides caccocaballi]
MPIEITKVSSRKELRTFAEYPNKLYKGNPYYVPVLVSDDMKTFDKKKNASFEFCDADYFLAYKDGKLVGRVAALINPRANDAWSKKTVRYGWIDFIDDREVSSALLKTVEDWGRERGMDDIEGPLGFTDFDTEGMLVDGFEELGTMITFYNHPYYMEHLEALGYTKRKDWVERRLVVPDTIPEKYGKYASLVAERNGLKVVRYTRKEIKQKGIGFKFFDLINRTYCVLYGYSQLSGKQMAQYVETYLSMLNLDYVSFIEDRKGDLAAFGVMIPSMSRALQKSGGKWLPFGWFHLMRALLFHKTDTADMLLIAVRPDLQAKGVPAMLISDIFPRLVAGGFKYAETNPELEDNYSVQNLWSVFESRQHRRRRIYGKEMKA